MENINDFKSFLALPIYDDQENTIMVCKPGEDHCYYTIFGITADERRMPLFDIGYQEFLDGVASKYRSEITWTAETVAMSLNLFFTLQRGIDPFQLTASIQEVRDEIGMRFGFYGKQVKAGKMAQQKMDLKISNLAHVRDWLYKLKELLIK